MNNCRPASKRVSAEGLSSWTCARAVCVWGVFGHTVPLLKGGPLHVDVGSARQVDLAGSFKNRSRFLDTL